MSTLQAFVQQMRHEADGIVSVELRPAAGGEVPPFEAGAHIDLHLANGLVRNYSLLNPPGERYRYVIGVLRDRASRGGSRFVHEQLRVGQVLPIAAPRNNFPLHEDAGHSVLIAGGIGITPILCMARRLREQGKSFEMIYLARSRASAAFLDELRKLETPMQTHFDDEAGGPPDLRALLAARSPRADLHLYACGPAPLLDAFEKHCAELGHENAHIERFAAVEHKAADDARKTYVVNLVKSNKSFTVTPDKSLLDQLLDAGIDCDHSCCEGVCGTCQTRVLEGVPDHRDSILTAKEKASNQWMMVCVSGCKSETLSLDL
jgi:ferredoxin-NADP reductase